MSTIASPRPSISIRSPSSSRTSQEFQPAQRQAANPRRNRAALRDYYGLRSAAPLDVSSGAQLEDAAKEESELSELDKPGFDAPAYVKNVLAKESLEGVLKTEGALVSGMLIVVAAEIRGFDGERKALVYDNYSKLIAATDTIRKMRSNMDPLTPTTSTLAPAISHIAETAATLSTSLTDRTSHPKEDVETPSDKEEQNQRATVRWVLDCPRRLRDLVTEGETDAAEADWEETRKILDKWKGVSGVEEIRNACEEALRKEETE
ncbi:Vps51/Vps67-domain-containing protein [Lineolata rhizophorae]|uniref:Vacuolar protein sorting-associated protein 51 homolog n=1 Tax=Lineolata rhizophorae TaxID=578093 RepID=A0A6A6P685_9PEZI|nr:Vps51/Vps67-domain-containing protein [Lineolata rhizophorae]